MGAFPEPQRFAPTAVRVQCWTSRIHRRIRSCSRFLVSIFMALQNLFCVIVSVCLIGLFQDASIGSVTFRELRVVGGFDVNITNIPYQLALEYSGTPYCSAAIISETHAVTASHCLERYDPNLVAVRSGTSQRSSGGHILRVKNFTRNPKFNRSELDYDVAVIELIGRIEFDAYQRAIPLATVEASIGENVTVSGWGRTKEKGDMSGNLKSVNVSIIDRELCRKYYKDKVNITDRMFCAGGVGHDSCHGDSGAPAARDGKLVGIVSWGYGCARESYPGVYTNLLNPEIRGFIKDVSGI